MVEGARTSQKKCSFVEGTRQHTVQVQGSNICWWWQWGLACWNLCDVCCSLPLVLILKPLGSPFVANFLLLRTGHSHSVYTVGQFFQRFLFCGGLCECRIWLYWGQWSLRSSYSLGHNEKSVVAVMLRLPLWSFFYTARMLTAAEWKAAAENLGKRQDRLQSCLFTSCLASLCQFSAFQAASYWNWMGVPGCYSLAVRGYIVVSTSWFHTNGNMSRPEGTELASTNSEPCCRIWTERQSFIPARVVTTPKGAAVAWMSLEDVLCHGTCSAQTGLFALRVSLLLCFYTYTLFHRVVESSYDICKTDQHKAGSMKLALLSSSLSFLGGCQESVGKAARESAQCWWRKSRCWVKRNMASNV